MLIILPGRVPSKKNSRRNFVTASGRQMSLPSESYEEWHEISSWELKKQIKKPLRLSDVKITLIFYPPDRRIGDLTNKAESVMDLLVDNEILKDDNWFVVKRNCQIFGGIDKENPRVEITIE